MLRITGGKFKGQTIETPDTGRTHPMGERERIALFNMLGDSVKGNHVLDAYAGSGALGIEAISRGAQFVLFMDKSRVACRTIDDNLKKLGLYGYHGGALLGDVPRVAATATDRFDIVFADPPYDKYEPRMIECLVPLVAEGIGALLVVSHPDEAPDLPGMTLLKTKKYAGAHISIYQKD